MTRTKALFIEDTPGMSYAALGDSSSLIIAIHHIICHWQLDAFIVPPPAGKTLPLWKLVFGERLATLSTIPQSHKLARIIRPKTKDHWYGYAGFDVFECILWEHGFFDTRHLRISPPIVFRCNPDSKNAMVYPREHTNGNAVYNGRWWAATASMLNKRGYHLNVLGDTKLLGYRRDQATQFPANIDGLRNCIAASSIAIGATTGPTWACLMSDIPQIVLESKRTAGACWHFDRVQRVIDKKLSVLPRWESLL
jgi:hypothetical protein